MTSKVKWWNLETVKPFKSYPIRYITLINILNYINMNVLIKLLGWVKVNRKKNYVTHTWRSKFGNGIRGSFLQPKNGKKSQNLLSSPLGNSTTTQWREESIKCKLRRFIEHKDWVKEVTHKDGYPFFFLVSVPDLQQTHFKLTDPNHHCGGIRCY